MSPPLAQCAARMAPKFSRCLTSFLSLLIVDMAQCRILLYPPGTILAIGYLIYGWTVQYHQHWIAPAVGLVFIGAGMITFTLPCILYTIDAFTLHAASALAAM